MARVLYKPLSGIIFFCFTWNALIADSISNEKRIVHLEKQVATLQSQSLSSEQKYAALVSNILAKLSANSNEIPRLRSDLDSLQQEHNQTLRELDWTRRELRVLASQYSDLKAKHDSIANETIMNRSELDTAVGNITDLVQVMSRVQSYVHTLPNVISSPLQVPNASLLADNKQQLQQQAGKMVVLENKVNQAEQSLKLMQVNATTNTKELETIAAHIKLMQTDIKGLKSQGSHFQTVLPPLQKLVAAHHKQIAAAAGTAQQALARLGTLQVLVNTDAKKYNQHITVQDARMTANGKTLAALNRNQGALRTRISNLETQLAATNRRLVTAQQNIGRDQAFASNVNVPLVFVVGLGSTYYGPSYDIHKGTFTAVTAGVYMFWINVDISSHGGQATLEIIKQGSVIARGTAGAAPIVAVTRVKLHEQVWFTKISGNNDVFRGSKNTHIGGVLLYTL